MDLVFINYRRRDDAYAAALLDHKLSEWLGGKHIFRASRSIPAGSDFEEAIEEAIHHSCAMLVMIGPHWEDSLKKKDPMTDYVLREIELASSCGVRLVPVLLTGAKQLVTMQLPVELDNLDRRQYLRFDYRAIEQDAERIAAEMCRLMPDFHGGEHQSMWLTKARRIAAAVPSIWGSVQSGLLAGQIRPKGSLDQRGTR